METGTITSLISLLISLIALCISAGIFWKNYLTPFSPELSIGEINLIPKTNVDPNGNTILQLNIGLPIQFYNKGAIAGQIQDLAIKMEIVGGNNFKAVYFPILFFSFYEYIQLMIEKKPDIYAMKGNFVPIFLPAKGQLFKELFFIIDKPPLVKFNEGKYKFTFFMKHSNKDFIEIGSRYEVIKESDIADLLGGTNKSIFNCPDRDIFADANMV